MKRLAWFAAGAVSGAYTFVKARRTAENFTPRGVAARAAAFGAGFRVFTHEVSAGMAEREAELRRQLELPAVETRPRVLELLSHRSAHESTTHADS